MSRGVITALDLDGERTYFFANCPPRLKFKSLIRQSCHYPHYSG